MNTFEHIVGFIFTWVSTMALVRRGLDAIDETDNAEKKGVSRGSIILRAAVLAFTWSK